MPRGYKTPGLEDAVRKYYPTMSCTEVASIVGVDASMVWRCAHRLGIKHEEATSDRLKKKAKSRLVTGKRTITEAELRKRSETQKRIRRAESYRVAIGMKQKTKYHVRTVPIKTEHAMALLRRDYNYFYDTVDDMTMYYDSETKRNPREQYFIDKYHLRFEQGGE